MWVVLQCECLKREEMRVVVVVVSVKSLGAVLFEASCFELRLFLGLMGDFDSNEWSL